MADVGDVLTDLTERVEEFERMLGVTPDPYIPTRPSHRAISLANRLTKVQRELGWLQGAAWAVEALLGQLVEQQIAAGHTDRTWELMASCSRVPNAPRFPPSRRPPAAH